MEILKDREGMVVYREGNVVIKAAKDEVNALALSNAYRFHKTLNGFPFMPALVSYVPGQLSYEFVEEDAVTDTELARRNVARMLHILRQRHVIHGDMTAPNLFFRNNQPVVIDWDQAIFTHEPKPQKRPKSDAVHVWPAVVAKAGDPSRVIRRWLACLPYLEYYIGWGSFLDLGTHMGDFVALAAAQGFQGRGVDGEHIRPCIQEATALWSHYGCDFVKYDIVEYLETSISYDVIMLFSTWPYIVQQRGEQIAREVLKRCIELSSIFLFEVQLLGDGPGPEFLRNKEDVIALLLSCGASSVEEVITIKVESREAERTVWEVK